MEPDLWAAWDHIVLHGLGETGEIYYGMTIPPHTVLLVHF